VAFIVLDVCSNVALEVYIPTVADPEVFEWVDVLSVSSEISLNRGISLSQNVFGRAEAGELEAVIFPDTLSTHVKSYVRPNLDVRLLVDDTEVLFLGTVKSIKTEYEKFTKRAKTHVTAIDLVSTLANQADITASTSQSFESRITSIFPGADVNGGTVTLAPKKTPVSPWELMNIAANSEGGLVFPTRDGGMKAYGRNANYLSHVLELSDEPELAAGPFSDAFSDAFGTGLLHTCYTDIDISFDTGNVVNVMEITNISTDVGGEDVEEDIDDYSDTTSIDTYGEASLQVLTNLTTLAAIDDLADWVFDNFSTPSHRVETVTYIPESVYSTLVDLGDVVRIVWHGNSLTIDGDFLVTGVNHELAASNDGDEWSIKLNVYPLGDIFVKEPK